MAEMRTFQLMNAQPRVVVPRDPAKQTFTLYELYDDQGGKWVVRQDVFNHALPLLGQRVSAVCRVEQRDQYTNFFIDSLELAGNGYVQQAQAAQPQQQVSSPPAGAAQQQPQVIRQTVAPDERERIQSIHRQTAGKVAALISQGDTPDVFWENVVALTRFFDTGQVPQTRQTQVQPQRQNAAAYQQYDPTPTTYDPGPQPNQYETVGEDSIPF